MLNMSRPPLTSIEIARARLFDIDAERTKRIDAVIDFFGTGKLAEDPCGELLIDAAGAP